MLKRFFIGCHLASVPILIFAYAADSFAAEHPIPDQIQFNRDVRPILSDHCYACHGPDKNKREADLRLDIKAVALGDTEHPGPIVPGDPQASELIRRVVSDDPEERMPPPKFDKDLTPRQIEILRRWIAQDAPWQGHWSFQPIVRPNAPRLDAANDLDNPIDLFIQAQLFKAGLELSPEADRRTLARRLAFDLVGLPPTPERVDRFAVTTDSQSYEQLVDELFSSPHFGERMAMWWLDLVRYADSVGYHGDQPVSVSPFRDYVIAAFNDNKPFDRFTIEQLAGDLLPDASREQRIAAGYNRLGMMSAEGGVQPKEYLTKYVAERVRNLSGAWLGVTLGCCECHDHKYDPFQSADFYRFEAFFADIEERGLYGGSDFGPSMQVTSEEQQSSLDDFDRQISIARQILETPTPELEAAQLRWEMSNSHWQLLRPIHYGSLEGATLELKDDGSILASGKSADTDTYNLRIAEWPEHLTALRLEVLTDDSLPAKGPGRADNGNFVVSEIEAFAVDGEQETQLTLQNASATYEQTGAANEHPDKKWSAASAIDGDTRGKTWGWAVMEQTGRTNSAVFELKPQELEPHGELKIVLKQNLDNPRHTLGRFRMYASTKERPVHADQIPPESIRNLLAVAQTERTLEQAKELATYYRSIAMELVEDRKRLKQLEDQRQQLSSTVTTMLVTKTVMPRSIRVLPRGNWMDESGEEVLPAVPEMLGGKPLPGGQRLTRIDLANWVVSTENPLTARVTVNRLWKLFFGAGLSAKLDDLGAQGEWPSHPELLDWLAAEFRDSGWNIKHMVKLIVMSQAYRQRSWASPTIVEGDPYNRLLSHQSRWRLDAEMVRDTSLSISGLLVDRIGGPSVRPYQPAGYWAYLNFPQREWANGTGDELYRRGVYTHWQRQYLHPSLLAFDAASREECTADRPRSNTPLQALTMLNDPTYVEAARAFAKRILESDADDEQRLRFAARQSLSRELREQEQPILKEILSKHRHQYAEEPGNAAELLKVGALPLTGNDPVELAAWTSVARVLLNLHETITRN